MKNFIEYDDDLDDFECENELEKIQLKTQAESVLKEIQITKSRHFRRDIKKIAKYYIKQFFKNKKDINGSKINVKNIYKKESLERFINTNIVEATKIIYNSLSEKKYTTKNKKEEITQDIKLVNETLKKVYKNKIPQQFAGGMLLLYLEHCKGISLET